MQILGALQTVVRNVWKATMLMMREDALSAVIHSMLAALVAILTLVLNVRSTLGLQTKKANVNVMHQASIICL